MDEWINEIEEEKKEDIRNKYAAAKNDDERIEIVHRYHAKGHVNIVPIKYLEDYFKCIRIVSTNSTWYRGESEEHKLLIPKIYRNIGYTENTGIFDETEIAKVLKKERKYFQEFKRRGKSIVSRIDKDDFWSWYFLIQHYGGLTRLLDWSSNPAIALFMALDTSRDKTKDPVVYLLASTVLTHFAFKDINKDNPETGRVLYPGEDDTDKWISNIIDNNNNIPDSPIALLPANSDQRIISQKSCFTLFGKRLNGFIKDGKQIVCPCCDRRILHKIIIDGKFKDNLRQELIRIGVSSGTVFPGLEGLAKEINEEIYSKR